MKVLKVFSIATYVLVALVAVAAVGIIGGGLFLMSDVARDQDATCQSGDEEFLRKQFSIPAGAKFSSYGHQYKSYPGWFGCEGHVAKGTFQLTDEQYESYVKQVVQPAVWQSAPGLSIDSTNDREYAPGSLEWHQLPLSPIAYGYLGEMTEETKDVQGGWYYCAASSHHMDRTPHYMKRHSCDEQNPNARYSLRFAVLDTKNKRLITKFGVGA